MMGTATGLTPLKAGAEVARHTDDLSDLQRLGNLLAASGYFADAREMAQAAVKVMAGRELGLPPIASMMGVNIIKGKVALGAHLIASRILAHGYGFKHTRLDNKGCVLTFLDKQGRTLGESSFTEEDARKAGCFTDMYNKYPRNMYFSRAISNGAKWFTPEIFGGAPVYTPEELGAEVDAEGEMVHPAGGERIDTGGAPMNTRQAQRNVAERRIAEETGCTAAGLSGIDIPLADPGEARPASAAEIKKAICAAMERERERIGGDAYWRVLGGAGYERSDQVPSKKAGERILAEMRACPSIGEAPEPQYQATEDDLPSGLFSPESGGPAGGAIPTEGGTKCHQA